MAASRQTISCTGEGLQSCCLVVCVCVGGGGVISLGRTDRWSPDGLATAWLQGLMLMRLVDWKSA